MVDTFSYVSVFSKSVTELKNEPKPKRYVYPYLSCFSSFFPWRKPYLRKRLQAKVKWQLVAHGDYTSTANCRAKIPAKFKHFYFFITRFLVEPQRSAEH